METRSKAITKKFDSIISCIAESKNRVEVAALEHGMGLMLKRIFTYGIALDGNDMGPYSEAYLAKRIRARKINTVKNLYFEGNLFRSIQVGTYRGKNVIGFTDNDMAQIAEYQEESDIQVNRPIFGFTETETEETMRILREQVAEVLKKCLITK